MKKRILKRKNKTAVCKMRKTAGRAAALAAAACLLFGMAVPVYGEEAARNAGDAGQREASGQAPKVVITDIYHRHLGTADAPGGCYTVAIDHVHQGDESSGGDCYQKPVYHTHQGDVDGGGGCYVTPVYHQHEGDETQGGGCYGQEVCHEHDDSCYEEGSCVKNYTPGKVLYTYTNHCFNHGDTTFVWTEGTVSHSNCGQEDTGEELGYCQSCGFFAPTVHDYEIKTCGMEDGEVIRYEINCGRDEYTVERYETGCGKGENDIDGYELSCDKDVDGYGLGCGLDGDKPCGRLVLTNETEGVGEQAVLSVRLEDLSGGKLKPADNPFVWLDENGNRIGSGEKIHVNENGNYSVVVTLENKDVDERGLQSSILVDNIHKEKPVPSASPASSPGAGATPSSSPAPSATPSPTHGQGGGATPTSAPSGTEAPPEDDKDTGDGGGTGDEQEPEEDEITEDMEIQDTGEEEVSEASAEQTQGKGTGKSLPEEKNSDPTPSPTPASPVMKETKNVPLPENEAMEEIQVRVERKGRWSGIFADPLVRMVAITAGTLALIAGILLWLIYLRHGVKVYNDDGEGRMIYLGRCLVRQEEDMYAITIKESMVERACTNRYCIKPGLFRFGKDEDQELVVNKETKSVSVCLSREMIVML